MSWLPLSEYVPPAQPHPYSPSLKRREVERILRYVSNEYNIRHVWTMSLPERLKLGESLIPQLSDDPTLWRSEVRRLLGADSER